MSGFSISWLNLREPADVAARNKPLAHKALEWLELIPAPIVVDLGSGTGSTLRALSSLGGHGDNDKLWRLVDHDGDLLDEAVRRHAKEFQVEDHQSDLAIIEELLFGGARLVTASALFDLVSADLVNNLVKRLTEKGIGVYAALNYDGETSWSPPHPSDAGVLAAFNQDQRRDKGLGAALGPDASTYLQTVFTQAGYQVSVAPSPWHLTKHDAELVRELINGIANVVTKHSVLSKGAIAVWREFRLAHLQDGECTVGHQDLLALPV